MTNDFNKNILIKIAQLNNLRWKYVDKNQVAKVLEIDKKIVELKNKLK